MDDHWKDSVEDVATSLAAITAGAVPIVGPLLQAGVSFFAGSAQMRRFERDIIAIRTELEQAIAAGRIGDVEAALTSEAFLAGLQFAVRRSQETASEVRRRRLRRALVAGASDECVDPEATLRLVDRLDDRHVRVLAAIRALGTTTSGRFATVSPSRVEKRVNAREPQLPSSQVRTSAIDLASFGLIVHNQEWRLEDATVRRATADTQDELEDTSVEADEEYRLTDTGAELLRSIAKPAGAESSVRGQDPPS
jgi:hypothetical protein